MLVDSRVGGRVGRVGGRVGRVGGRVGHIFPSPKRSPRLLHSTIHQTPKSKL
jgi:hypothetical protein